MSIRATNQLPVASAVDDATDVCVYGATPGGVTGAARQKKVGVTALQARLHADRSATMYVSDVAPDAADFVAVQ